MLKWKSSYVYGFKIRVVSDYNSTYVLEKKVNSNLISFKNSILVGISYDSSATFTIKSNS